MVESSRSRCAARTRWSSIPSRIRSAREAIHHLVARYGSPLFIIDAERVRRQYRRLAAALPGVDLHYALKPLPHPVAHRRRCRPRAPVSIWRPTARWSWCAA